jgi:hypothetical protein
VSRLSAFTGPAVKTRLFGHHAFINASLPWKKYMRSHPFFSFGRKKIPSYEGWRKGFEFLA